MIVLYRETQNQDGRVPRNLLVEFIKKRAEEGVKQA
jgi:hypothetical protein